MADDEQRKNDAERPEEEEGQPEDSGLGDLPPLSEFESSSGSSDSGLPPLGDLESDPGAEADEGREYTSGLPPLGDIPLETPSSDESDQEGSEGGYETPSGQTPASEDLETPSGTSFQDLGADSDFTPQTPVGESESEEESSGVPFDSAFGGGESDTSAPTQAMETPMFGQSDAGGQGGGQDMGFGQDSQDSGFGGSDFGAGTPPPDFSQDTGMGGGGQQPPAQYQPAEGGGGGGGVSVAITIVLLIAGLLVGIIAGPWVANLAGVFPGAINPYKTEIAGLEEDLETKDARIRDLGRQLTGLQETDGIVDETEGLQQTIDRLQQERQQLQTQVNRLESQYEQLQSARNEIEGDIDALEEQFAEYQDQYQQLQRDTAILSARREGLTAEIARLRDLTGELEEADVRRAMTKDAFEKALSRLAVLVREGSPLTPERYARQERLSAVRDLQQHAEDSKWVTPKLLNDFIDLYQKELRIAAERSYFFARIPVTDRYGHTQEKWAECLMNGNWSVYYRTLDGDHIGIFTNTNPTGAPDYEFIPVAEKEARSQLESEIMTARPEGFESQVQQLAERQQILEGPEGEWQRSFSAL